MFTNALETLTLPAMSLPLSAINVATRFLMIMIVPLASMAVGAQWLALKKAPR